MKLLSALLLCLAMIAHVANAAESSTPAPRDQEAGWKIHHEALRKRIEQGNVDLLFLGDSITQGWQGPGISAWTNHFAKLNAVNMGISGDRTRHLLWRIEHTGLEAVKPKVAVIMIGTNNVGADSAEDIGEGIIAVVKRLQEILPETKILLLAVFPRSEQPNHLREKLAKASEIAAKTADGKQIFYLDVGSKFTNADGSIPKELMPDFIHPSADGYEVWAKAIAPKVQELMK